MRLRKSFLVPLTLANCKYCSRRFNATERGCQRTHEAFHKTHTTSDDGFLRVHSHVSFRPPGSGQLVTAEALVAVSSPFLPLNSHKRRVDSLFSCHPAHASPYNCVALPWWMALSFATACVRPETHAGCSLCAGRVASHGTPSDRGIWLSQHTNTDCLSPTSYNWQSGHSLR